VPHPRRPRYQRRQLRERLAGDVLGVLAVVQAVVWPAETRIGPWWKSYLT